MVRGEVQASTAEYLDVFEKHSSALTTDPLQNEEKSKKTKKSV